MVLQRLDTATEAPAVGAPELRRYFWFSSFGSFDSHLAFSFSTSGWILDLLVGSDLNVTSSRKSK